MLNIDAVKKHPKMYKILMFLNDSSEIAKCNVIRRLLLEGKIKIK